MPAEEEHDGAISRAEIVAGRVGGEPVNGCGSDAKAICARSANYDNPRARTINAKCDEAGVVVTPAEIDAAAKAKALGLG